MTDFWKDIFMKKVQVKSTGETGTVIDMGSVDGTYIVEMDNPGKEDVYRIRDYRYEDFILISPEAVAV